ncbi:alpha/beta fold hydrolase [Acinetobacter sp. YH12140]|uniref:alpha/beta fold hydrolase n=1 Tax=Acinetobacter sp. YH12140 TaxID=2601124 RepID=UPI0015D294A9|nr:alpha/beta hydrolase [Acinetobacter sp. YH12140]
MPHYTMPDQQQLYVREYGQGEPILVLSGLGMQSWQWHPFLYQHRKHFKFIIPDWRGFGGSKHCQIPNMDTISSHWRDIDSLVSQLGYDKITVIAYSMGATTTMHGLKYGQFAEKIKRYLHIDQTPKIRVDEDWQYGLYGKRHTEFLSILEDISKVLATNLSVPFAQQMNKHDRQGLVDAWLRFIDLQNSNPYALSAFRFAYQQPTLQKLILPSQSVAYLYWYIQNYLNHTEDYREAIAALTAPTTFFTGAKSILYPAQGQKIIADSLVNAEQIIFKKSGHTPLISEPVKFSREITKFLKQAL